MTFQLISILIALAALCSYLNVRFVHLPTTIGVMVIALIASAVILALGENSAVNRWLSELMSHIDFADVLFHGMLAFLLFAGAIHLELEELHREALPVVLLAILGTLLSTLIVGSLTWWLLNRLGTDIELAWAMAFGALIAPTDPIAVLGIMRHVGASPRLQTQISGESLFNDGIGVVLFLLCVGIAQHTETLSVSRVSHMLISEVLGGAGVGLLLGFVAYRMLKRIENYRAEVLITVALASGVYAVAEALKLSAPIATVVAGLVVGNRGRVFAMSKSTRQRLDEFWELIDEFLNAVLFMLMGLQLVVLPFKQQYLVPGLCAIAMTLLARFVSVAGIVELLRRLRVSMPRGTAMILTWGGLRGGISVAMALSLPAHNHRHLLLAMTYCVVVFSIIVQGLSVGALIRRMNKQGGPADAVVHA